MHENLALAKLKAIQHSLISNVWSSVVCDWYTSFWPVIPYHSNWWKFM